MAITYPRRIVISRKGFDSAAGGCASPVLNGMLISLPIPEPDCSQAPCAAGHVTYGQLGKAKGEPGIRDLVTSLTRGKVSPDRCVHLDPDIRPELRKGAHRRAAGSTMLFGQVGSAQSELRSIGPGDLFLFFGWFREASESKGSYTFRPGAPDEHHLWGWLQVGRKLVVDEAVAKGEIEWQHRHHPHVSHAHTRTNNTLYEATERLSFSRGLPGAGIFTHASSRTRLTAPNAKTRSEWLLPTFFLETGLSRFNFSPEFWTAQSGSIRSHAPRCKGCGAASYGQEFVFETSPAKPRVHAWLHALFAESE